VTATGPDILTLNPQYFQHIDDEQKFKASHSGLMQRLLQEAFN